MDLTYPEDLHDKHNDMPLAPESIIIDGVRKLAPNLANKVEYEVTVDALRCYMDNGLVLTKIHTGIWYREDPVLK